ncbi:hypothetical protein B9Z55_008579 [Caenorhabditis nigoni]|uniref:Caspase family p10 domain-containing protein n=2 Tax=Caenorhabditis nigoni TaxID=1611254 RepID=A0A2G5UNJ2_9PELO|nr:hypothetical protein B9Z55_008579 [Caenorhabditis nigoni]
MVSSSQFFQEHFSSKNDFKKPKEMVFMSRGGSVEEMTLDLDFQFDDRSPKTRSRIPWLEILYSLITLLLIALIILSIRQKRLETSELTDSLQKFKVFNLKFQRLHENSDDLNYRFQLFSKNLKEIEILNSQNSGAKFEINEFTDRSEEELRHYSMDQKFMKKFSNLKLANSTILAGNLSRRDYRDWRNDGKVMSVKNQGQCGSCWAFSIVSAVESQFAIKKGTLWSLSEQELVDCDGDSYGCNGGFMDKALSWILGNGLETEDDYPYDAVRHDQCYLNGGKTRVWVDEGYRLANNEDFIADWIDSVGPVSFAMKLPKSFYSYSNGIYHPSEGECNDPNNGYHAMTLIGYGNEGGQLYWIVKNSWGSGWGDQGYMRLARGQNEIEAVLANLGRLQDHGSMAMVFMIGLFNKDAMLGRDGQTFDLLKVYTLLGKTHAPNLANKPKIEEQTGGTFLLSSFNHPAYGFEDEADGDFLMSFSSPNYYYSYSHPSYGSTFIRCICQSMARMAHNHHIEEIMMIVKSMVSRIERQRGERTVHHITKIQSSLRKEAWISMPVMTPPMITID